MSLNNLVKNLDEKVIYIYSPSLSYLPFTFTLLPSTPIFCPQSQLKFQEFLERSSKLESPMTNEIELNRLLHQTLGDKATRVINMLQTETFVDLGRCDYCDVLCPQETLKVDGRCKKKYYCSVACQKSDWPLHKQFCMSPREEQNEHDECCNNNVVEYMTTPSPD